MSNYTVQEYIQAVNNAFKVNTEVLYAAIDDGTFSEFTLAETKECYKYSNRKLLVCQIRERVSEEYVRAIEVPTKGYAVAQIAKVANEYIASKVKVEVVDYATEVLELRAQVAELKTEVAQQAVFIEILTKSIKLQAKGMINSVVKAILG